MTVKIMAIGVLICIIIIGMCLLLLFQNKYEFYHNLIKQSEEIISKCNQSTPIKVTIDSFNNKLTIDSIYARIFVLSKDNRVQEIRYFKQNKLIALDILGEDARIVRRDIFDTKVHIRVRLFYENERRVQEHFLDEKEKIIFNKSLFIPIGGRLGVY